MIFCHSQIEAVGDLTQSLPLPLKGEGLGIAFLGFVGVFTQRSPVLFRGKDGYFVSEGFSRQLPVATAGHSWPNRAGLGLRWCPFPYPVPKTAHRATQGRVWHSLSFPGALLVRQGCQTLGSNAFMHSLFNTSFGKPYSLFTPPQILRRPLPCFGVSKRLEFLPAFAIIFIPQPGSGQTA